MIDDDSSKHNEFDKGEGLQYLVSAGFKHWQGEEKWINGRAEIHCPITKYVVPYKPGPVPLFEPVGLLQVSVEQKILCWFTYKERQALMLDKSSLLFSSSVLCRVNNAGVPVRG